MLELVKLIFTLIIYGLSLVKSARILAIYPVPAYSHQSVFQVLTEELSRQGHEQVVMTPLPNEKPLANVTFIDVHELSYGMKDQMIKLSREKKKAVSVAPLEFKKFISPLFVRMLHDQFESPEMQALFRGKDQQHFDLILADDYVPLSVMAAAKFNAPIILLSSYYGQEETHAFTGTPIHPLIFPQFNFQRNYHLSFWEKISTLYMFLKLRTVNNYYIQDVSNKILKEYFGNNSPTLSELQKNVQMLFINIHPIWNNNRPVPPSVVYLGGLNLKKPKPIPRSTETLYTIFHDQHGIHHVRVGGNACVCEDTDHIIMIELHVQDLQTYLDSSENGVVYFSMGTSLKYGDLPPAMWDMFFKVFESLQFDFLVKCNECVIQNEPPNVRLETWLPQNDLLHHPKIKAFIMQGGLQSTDEAIAANVPLIGLPVFGDQWCNAEKFVQFGIGVKLDLNNLKEQDLKEAIFTVTEDTSYRDNIARLSRVMEDQRAGGLQKAVYWIEHVAKYGALHLRSPLADATFTDLFMLDVLGAASVVVMVIVTVSVIIVKEIGNKLFH